jgi:hypothetical protein
LLRPDGTTENEIGVVEAIMREVCCTPVADDGLSFDATSVVRQRMKEDSEDRRERTTPIA